jgi:translation elongation factor EF-1beta
MGLSGLIDEARHNGTKIVRHWKMHEGQSTSESAMVSDPGLGKRVTSLESENKAMKGQISDLSALVKQLQAQVQALTVGGGKGVVAPPPKKEEAKEEEDEDEDIDLFGSSDEEDDEEKEKIKQQRLEAYNAKKSKKPGPIAKSSVILDIKPWDDETDMKALEGEVKKIEMDGLLWGASKLVPVAFGIKKLQIMCVVEDEKVSIDELTEKIEEFEDYVQSVDIAAFNKI